MASAIHTLMARGHLTSLLCLLATLLMARAMMTPVPDHRRTASTASGADATPCVCTPMGDAFCRP